jgi:hypothetical protein
MALKYWRKLIAATNRTLGSCSVQSDPLLHIIFPEGQ